MPRAFSFATAVLALAALPLAGHALCTSDGVPQPRQLLERFTNADCAACWRDPATPAAGADTLALDWNLPGSQGDVAPLSAAASSDALERLQELKRAAPARAGSASSRRTGAPLALRLAQGEAFNDYIGASLELRTPGRTRWQAWLLLVEALPVGAEGSPVPRNVVRNAFRPDWARATAGPGGLLAESRAMQIHEGARPERLRLVAVLQDGHGRIRAIAQTGCSG
jgi:hypothetical protein